METSEVATTTTGSDRRARRRQETIEEILDIAEHLMAQDGVHALSLSEVARRLGVQPPSLYKYFPSLMAIYDALFERGQQAHLAAMRSAMHDAAPGLAALNADDVGDAVHELPLEARKALARDLASGHAAGLRRALAALSVN